MYVYIYIYIYIYIYYATAAMRFTSERSGGWYYHTEHVYLFIYSVQWTELAR